MVSNRDDTGQLCKAYRFTTDNNFLGSEFYIKKADIARAVVSVLRSTEAQFTHSTGSYTEKLDTLIRVLAVQSSDFDMYFKHDIGYLRDTYKTIEAMCKESNMSNSYMFYPELEKALTNTLTTIKNTVAAFLTNFVPDSILADVFLELISGGNGSWELVNVSEDTLTDNMWKHTTGI